jgi:hypothetical protein
VLCNTAIRRAGMRFIGLPTASLEAGQIILLVS